MHKSEILKFLALLVVAGVPIQSNAQSFYFGHDLSYVNQMEDCGAVYKEDGVPRDVYMIFAGHGTNLIRVRLWVDPSWWQQPLQQPEGVKSFYNDPEDVKETIRRCKEAGMQVMLDLHYSDFWADPGRQLIPRAWINTAHDLAGLKDSVYNYTARILRVLDQEGLMPDIVKIGNETNSGILTQIPESGGYDPIETVSTDWARHAQLFNAAIKAVRDVGATASINPRIALHFTNKLSGQVWNFTNIISKGVKDFDIMGISYYYAWHGGNISQLESTIKSLVTKFPGYDVMVVETGYLWTTQNFDQMNNIINEPDPQYLPVIPEKQLEYMVDYARAVMRSGGKGVVFWEPAWVSTPCRTPWGQGSSHDHVAFFEPATTNFMENGGGKWTESRYYTDIHAKKVIFKVDMTGQDDSKGVFITGDFTGEPWITIPMAKEGNGVYSYFTYLAPGDSGEYYFLNGTNPDKREVLPETCTDISNHNRLFCIDQAGNIFSDKWEVCDGTVTGERALDKSYDGGLNVYPNPGYGQFYVTFPRLTVRSRIDIIDTSGKIRQSMDLESNSTQITISLRDLPPEMYILKYSGEEKTYFRKLLYIN